MDSKAFEMSASTLVQWLDELGQISDEAGKLTRTFLSPAMERARRLVGALPSLIPTAEAATAPIDARTEPQPAAGNSDATHASVGWWRAPS